MYKLANGKFPRIPKNAVMKLVGSAAQTARRQFKPTNLLHATMRKFGGNMRGCGKRHKRGGTETPLIDDSDDALNPEETTDGTPTGAETSATNAAPDPTVVSDIKGHFEASQAIVVLGNLPATGGAEGAETTAAAPAGTSSIFNFPSLKNLMPGASTNPSTATAATTDTTSTAPTADSLMDVSTTDATTDATVKPSEINGAVVGMSETAPADASTATATTADVSATASGSTAPTTDASATPADASGSAATAPDTPAATLIQGDTAIPEGITQVYVSPSFWSDDLNLVKIAQVQSKCNATVMLYFAFDDSEHPVRKQWKEIADNAAWKTLWHLEALTADDAAPKLNNLPMSTYGMWFQYTKA